MTGAICPECGESTFHQKRSFRECSRCGAVGWDRHQRVVQLKRGTGSKCPDCDRQTLHLIHSSRQLRRCSFCDFSLWIPGPEAGSVASNDRAAAAIPNESEPESATSLPLRAGSMPPVGPSSQQPATAAYPQAAAAQFLVGPKTTVDTVSAFVGENLVPSPGAQLGFEELAAELAQDAQGRGQPVAAWDAVFGALLLVMTSLGVSWDPGRNSFVGVTWKQ
jgi:hypothetical protein